jgi:hypothetical protein
MKYSCCVLPPSTAKLEETAAVRQWNGKHVPGETNIHATTDERLDAVSSMPSVSYQILNICSQSKVD